MKVIRSVKRMQQFSQQNVDQTIGFVPTMGYLHEGHTSLMKKAAKENDLVVASIFVNPLQFGPKEDYDTYPRDEDHDQKKAEANGVDVLFIPDVNDMYPEPMKIKLSIDERTNVLCGASRKGHFDGVITVLTKLFNIVQPTTTYFGLKDAQQVAVVASLLEELNFPIRLSAEPTIREADGLAKSSRNVNLSDQEREEAKNLYKALCHGLVKYKNEVSTIEEIITSVHQYLTTYTNGKVEYVDLLSYPDLNFPTEVDEFRILAIAVKYKHARLIDNIIFDRAGNVIDAIMFNEF